MLLKIQRNEILNVLQKHGIPASSVNEEKQEAWYQVDTELDGEQYAFYLQANGPYYTLEMNPGVTSVKTSAQALTWPQVMAHLDKWAEILALEAETPDLWAEAAKTAQLFAPTATPSDDKFTRTELAEVQGQLRQLQQSFATAALPEAARQNLIELTQTAAVKAEGLTKKDWQNWIIGGFISGITALALNPAQAADVLRLVKAAFGGLFLH